jgi:hypothetical protein
MYERYYYEQPKDHPVLPVEGVPATFVTVMTALSPTAWWRVGEASGNCADSSGSGLTLTAGGTLTYDVAGWTGDGDGGLTFASTSYLTHADDAAFDMGTGDFSVMWAHKMAPGWPNAQQIIGHPGQALTGDWYIRFRDVVADNLQLTLQTTNYYIATTADTLDTGAWVMCVLTVDRSANAVLYVDGYTEYTKDVSASSALSLTNTSVLYIGANNTSGSRQLVGSLDEIAIWKGTILSQAQVRSIYDAKDD